MNKELQIKYWIDGSAEDISTAQILIEKERFLHGLFFCHLAMEKVLKAVYVKIKNEFAPKTHNLLYLCELCGIELSDERMTFYAILMKYQITGRYPENTAQPPEQETVIKYYEKVMEEILWLKQKLNQ